MGWESRNNRSYYYAKARHGNRVVSTYLGRGAVAQIQATLIEKERDKREAAREAERSAIEQMRASDAAFDQVDALVMDLTKAHLTEAGFHQHKRTWRRKRCSKR